MASSPANPVRLVDPHTLAPQRVSSRHRPMFMLQPEFRSETHHLRTTARSWAALLITILAIGAQHVSGQRLPEDSGSCEECQFSLELTAILSEEPGHGHIPVHAVVEGDGSNGFYLGPVGESGALLHYDRHGDLRSDLSAFTTPVPPNRRASLIMGLHDGSLDVIDNARRVLKTLEPLEGRILKEIPLPATVSTVYDLTRTRTGAVTIQARVRGASYFGLPLHDLTDEGTVIRSFGSEEEILGLHSGPAGQRRLASGDGDSIWSAHVTRYRIDLYNAKRELVRVLHRQADWFSPWTQEPEGSFRSRPPLPRIADVELSRFGGRVNTEVCTAS